MCTCVLRLGCFLLTRLCSLLRPTVLLPVLPDVHLSVPREVQVQPPVRLPLGDRGHIRLRDTPHIKPLSPTHQTCSPELLAKSTLEVLGGQLPQF